LDKTSHFNWFKRIG